MVAGFPWVTAGLLALPGVVLGVAGGLVGATSAVGLALVGAGVAYLALDLTLLQPRVLARTSGGDRRERAAQLFLDRALALDSVAEVADQLARAVAAGVGPARSFLLAPADGGIRIFGPAGSEPPPLSDAGPALAWLGEQRRPVRRADLATASGEGATEVEALLDATGCDVALPLRYRGLLLGVGLIGVGGAYGDASTFYRALCAYATVAVANTFLGASAAGGAAVTSTIDLATSAQESLMPEERLFTGTGFALRGVYRPVAECGGDLWAWRELDDGRLLVVIADATGHGAAPALLAAAARGAIDGAWQTGSGDLEPAALLSVLNRAVYRTGRRRYLMTAFALVLDPQSGELTFANAGQNFPYVISGDSIQALVARGNPLGSAPEAEFAQATRMIEAGDRILLFTDGLVEAEGPNGDPFGERRFRNAVTQLAGERVQRMPERLLSAVLAHTGERPIEDDLTLVVVERAVAAEGEEG